MSRFTKEWNHEDKTLDLKWHRSVRYRDLELTVQSSDTLKDWFYHLWVMPKAALSGAVVHAGFYARALKIFSKVSGDYETVSIYGHSLGGGVGLLLAHLFAEAYPLSRVECVVAGAPKVYYRFPKRGLPYEVTAFSYGNDVVTKLPPWGTWEPEVPLYVGGPPRKWWKLSVKDHEPKNYEELYEQANADRLRLS